MNHSQIRASATRIPCQTEYHNEWSVYRFIQHQGPISFEELVLKVQGKAPNATRNDVARDLGGLLRQRRIYLNQEKTGFLAVGDSEAERNRRFMESATKKSITFPGVRAQF